MCCFRWIWISRQFNLSFSIAAENSDREEQRRSWVPNLGYALPQDVGGKLKHPCKRKQSVFFQNIKERKQHSLFNRSLKVHSKNSRTMTQRGKGRERTCIYVLIRKKECLIKLVMINPGWTQLIVMFAPPSCFINGTDQTCIGELVMENRQN